MRSAKLSTFVIGSTIGAFITLSVGCDSKFVESSPDSIAIEGMSLEERLNNKVKVDQRIDQIEAGAKKIKKIVKLLKKVKKSSQNADVYTPIDFLVDLNTELKIKMPENGEANRPVRRGVVEIPISSLSAECKKVKTTLVSDTIYSEDGEEKIPVGERLVYSFSTCGSEGKYLPAVEAKWIGTVLEFKFNKKNLETIFTDIAVVEALDSQNCKLTQTEEKIIKSLECSNFTVRLSTSEIALVNKMAFDNEDDVRFEAFADIYENGRKKAISTIRVFRNGKTDIDLEKINEETSSAVESER